MRFNQRAIYFATETSYAVSPRPADADYRALPVAGDLSFSGGPGGLATNRFTGRTGQTPFVPGQTNAEGSFALELLGLQAQGGDGDAPPAEDHVDLLLGGVAAGTPVDRSGLAASGLAGTPAVDLTLGSDGFDVGDLVCLEDASGRVAWAAVVTDGGAGAYTLDFEPQVDGAAITPAVARPIRQWRDDDGGDSIRSYAGMYRLGLGAGASYREVPGIRVSSLQVAFAPNAYATASFGLQGDDYRVPGSAPSFSTGVNGDPAVVATPARITGCVYIDGVLYDSASASVDFGIELAERPSTCRRSGRIDRLQIAVTPVVNITTPFDDQWDALNSSKELRDIKVVSGRTGPSVCFWVPHGQITANPQVVDTNGLTDQSVAFTAMTVGAGLRWAVARS